MNKFFSNKMFRFLNVFKTNKKESEMKTGNNEQKEFDLIKNNTDPYQILEIYSSVCVEKIEINENIISLQKKAEEAVDSILSGISENIISTKRKPIRTIDLIVSNQENELSFQRMETILGVKFSNKTLNCYRLDLLIKVGKFQNSLLKEEMDKLIPEIVF